MKSLATVILSLSLLAGCTATAIIPAKVTYTYPLLEPFQCYETGAGIGAVAYIDNGSMELYLPRYAPNLFASKRFVFNATEREGTWAERSDPDLRAVMATEETTLPNSCGTHLKQGMLLVTFPDNRDRYGETAGKRMWLTSTAGPDEIFMVRGVYWKWKLPFEGVGR